MTTVLIIVILQVSGSKIQLRRPIQTVHILHVAKLNYLQDFPEHSWRQNNVKYRKLISTSDGCPQKADITCIFKISRKFSKNVVGMCLKEDFDSNKAK